MTSPRLPRMRSVSMGSEPVVTSEVGFGCSSIMGLRPRDRARLLGYASDSGIRHFDVAPLYGIGRAEFALGKFLEPDRSRFTITTKIGLKSPPLAVGAVTKVMARTPAKGAAARLSARFKHTAAALLTPTAVARSVEHSLRALRTGHLDFLMLHECRAEDVTSELVDQLLALKASGTVRAIGTATSHDDSARIHKAFPGAFEVSQMESNVLRPAPAMPAGVGLFTHRSLGEAFREISTRARDEDFRTRCREGAGVDPADSRDLGRVMFAWSRAANPDGVVLFSTTSGDRLTRNVLDLTQPTVDSEQLMAFSRIVSD